MTNPKWWPCPECGRMLQPQGAYSHLSTCLVPLICVCATAVPVRSGECRNCLRRVAQLMDAPHFLAARATYPTVATQAIDWTHWLSRHTHTVTT